MADNNHDKNQDQEQNQKRPKPSPIVPMIIDFVFTTYTVILFFFCWPLTIAIKLSPQFNDYFFANVFSYLVNSMKGSRNPFKDKFFKSLNTDQIVSCDQRLRSENKIRLLDIGVGPGTNLKYYPKNTSLIAIDNNAYFKEYFDDNLTEFHHLNNTVPKLTLEKFLICSAENMNDIEDSSVDVVVAIHLLCCVRNPEKVLSEIHRVLSPGGRYYMLEHVAHQEWIDYSIQWLIKPFWSVFNGGCNLQSETMKVIEASGLFKGAEDVQYEILRVPFPFSTNIYGLLVK